MTEELGRPWAVVTEIDNGGVAVYPCRSEDDSWRVTVELIKGWWVSHPLDDDNGKATPFPEGDHTTPEVRAAVEFYLEQNSFWLGLVRTEIALLDEAPVQYPRDWLLPSFHGVMPYIQQLIKDGFRFDDDVWTGDLKIYGPAQEIYGEGKGLYHPLIHVIPPGNGNKTAFWLTWLWQNRKSPEKYLKEREEKGLSEAKRPTFFFTQYANQPPQTTIE